MKWLHALACNSFYIIYTKDFECWEINCRNQFKIFGTIKQKENTEDTTFNILTWKNLKMEKNHGRHYTKKSTMKKKILKKNSTNFTQVAPHFDYSRAITLYSHKRVVKRLEKL